MSFKTKNKIKKKEDFDNRITLDAKHTLKINHFKKTQMLLKQKEKLLVNLETKLMNLNKKKEVNNELVEEKISLKDKIYDIKNDIKNLNNKCNDIDYFLDTGTILFQYYDEKKNESKNKYTTNFSKNKNKNKNNTKSVIEYFGSKDLKDNNTTKKGNSSEKKKDSKAKLLERYLLKIDDDKGIEHKDINIEIFVKSLKNDKKHNDSFYKFILPYGEHIEEVEFNKNHFDLHDEFETIIKEIA